jgi:hypothetical protein
MKVTLCSSGAPRCSHSGGLQPSPSGVTGRDAAPLLAFWARSPHLKRTSPGALVAVVHQVCCRKGWLRLFGQISLWNKWVCLGG